MTQLHPNMFYTLLWLLFGTINTTRAQLPAFPGAEGFGRHATGGRGGKVAAVTNLQDDGPGSFREALNAFPGQPLTIVFRVSGIIELRTPLSIRRSDLTIAGQTAPGDGICLKGHSLVINGAVKKSSNKGNIIVRYLRSRPGSTVASGVYGLDVENCHNVIIDHCSFSWANEECLAIYDVKNITLQWCIISEGLYEAGHQKGHRSYGGVWGGQYASYHHNLLAHLNSRAVRFNGSRAHDTIAIVDYRNNVVYNWGNTNACYGGDIKIPGGISQVNIVNNFYQPGPATSDTLKFLHAMYAPNAEQQVGQWYLSGNVMLGDKKITYNNWLAVDLRMLPDTLRKNATATQPFSIKETIQQQNAKEAWKKVLAHAGAVLPARDAVDKRIVAETKNRSAKGKGVFGKPGIIDSPMAVGGWPVYASTAAPADTDGDGMPDEWERKHHLNPADPSVGIALHSSGYTQLEEYLNSLVLAVSF